MLHRPEFSLPSTFSEPKPASEGRTVERVVGVPIDVLDWDDACRTIGRWASRRESRYVCICNVHSVVTARIDPEFMKVIENADMATADGAPVAWMLRRLGHADQRRINGPDLMLRYFAQAEQRGEAVFLYGSTPATPSSTSRPSSALTSLMRTSSFIAGVATFIAQPSQACRPASSRPAARPESIASVR